MEDLTFIIPVMIDSEDRLYNLRNNILNLNQFDSPVMIVDSSYGRFKNKLGILINADKIVLSINDDCIFRKSKLINIGVNEIKTDYFAMIDTDALFKKEQIKGAYGLLKQQDCVVYPYSGLFLDINTSVDFPNLPLENTKKLHENSVGGAFFCNKRHFFEIGGMNENFVSWGYEDDEFHYRAQMLSTVRRWAGACYHQTHPRGDNSSSNNPYYENNKKEYQRILKMSKPQLINEIKTWPWCQKKY